MVFYLNKEAPKRRYLDHAEPLEEDRHSVLRIEYETCAGMRSKRHSLIFPDTSAQCNVQIGGFANRALRYTWYLKEKDNHLLFPVEAGVSQKFSSSDYITVAFYGFRRDFPQGSNKEHMEGKVWSNFELLATDKTKYYFQNNYDFSLRKPPLPPENLNFSFDKVKSILKTSWDKSKDPDTFDKLLHYEISYDGGASWENTYSNLQYEKIIESNKVYNIAVRAFDNFNLRSETAAKNFSSPSINNPFGLSNIRWGKLDNNPDFYLRFNYPNYPLLPEFQDNNFDMMVFYLNELPPLNYRYSAVRNNHPESSGNIPYPRLITSHLSCAHGNSLRDFPVLLLARSEAVVSLFLPDRTIPNYCFGWAGELPTLALVPVPPSGQPGSVNLPITGLSNVSRLLSNLNSSDYITIGFYSVDSRGNVSLIGNDTNKYYFSNY